QYTALSLPDSSIPLLLHIRSPPSSPLFPYTTLFRSTSEDVFTQAPLQQTWLFAQAYPHAPQCITLLRRSTHVLLHTVFPAGQTRSEEHTSELQSLTNLVCRLLLEKKKQKHRTTIHQQ